MTKFLAKPQRFMIRPAPGWVDLTLLEAQAILASPLQPYKFTPRLEDEGGVVIVSDCDYRQALELVTRLTTAHDIEWVLHSGRLGSRSEWPMFLQKSGVTDVFAAETLRALKVSATVVHSVVGTAKDVKIAAAKLWDLPDVMTDNESDLELSEYPQRIRIDSTKNRTRILVSMAGSPLYKRGYKAPGGIATAPLPEHHASACYLWTVSALRLPISEGICDGEIQMAVPFAGTGTTGFESACRAIGFAPGISRGHYGCEDFLFHPGATMKTIRSRLQKLTKQYGEFQIQFGDINTDACAALKLQAQSFLDHTNIKVRTLVSESDFLSGPITMFESQQISQKKIFLPLNPPYGQRLAKHSGGESIYARLGKSLARLNSLSSGVCGYVICPDELSWQVLLRELKGFEFQSRHFTHGGNDTRLVAFKSRNFA